MWRAAAVSPGVSFRLLPARVRSGGPKASTLPHRNQSSKRGGCMPGLIFSPISRMAPQDGCDGCALVDALGSFLGELLDELLRALGLE